MCAARTWGRAPWPGLTLCPPTSSPEKGSCFFVLNPSILNSSDPDRASTLTKLLLQKVQQIRTFWARCPRRTSHWQCRRCSQTWPPPTPPTLRVKVGSPKRWHTFINQGHFQTKNYPWSLHHRMAFGTVSVADMHWTTLIILSLTWSLFWGDWRRQRAILSPPTAVSDSDKHESSYWILWKVLIFRKIS